VVRCDAVRCDMISVTCHSVDITTINLFGTEVSLPLFEFYSATLDGSDFENADMTQANIELAQLKGCNLKNTIARQMCKYH
jgi:uncharacterized protein YjbI with pentapeptide repeats